MHRKDHAAMIPVKGQSQYSDTVKEQYRSSACGPVTISVILEYWQYTASANDLYKRLGATRIGSFRFLLVYKLRKMLGKNWTIQPSNRIDEVIDQLDRGCPVAAKFDKYFTLRFFSRPMYAYHWVVVTGYEIRNGTIFLYFHDNGRPGRDSKVRSASFQQQAGVLRFLLLFPSNKKSPSA